MQEAREGRLGLSVSLASAGMPRTAGEVPPVAGYGLFFNVPDQLIWPAFFFFMVFLIACLDINSYI